MNMKKMLYIIFFGLLLFTGIIETDASVGVAEGTTTSVSVTMSGSKAPCPSYPDMTILNFSSSGFLCANCAAYFPGCSDSGCGSSSFTYTATDSCYPFGNNSPSQAEVWAKTPMTNGICSGCVSCSSVTAPSSGTNYYLQIYKYLSDTSRQSIGKVVSIQAPAQTGSIRINKECGNGVTGEFDFKIGQSPVDNIACGSSKVEEGIPIGNYTVTETTTGYKTSSGTTASNMRDGAIVTNLAVVAGETTNVYFLNEINTPTTGTLKISKICDGFTEKSFTFNVKNSSNNDARSKTIACGSNSSLTLAPGTYTVTETVPAGYSTTNPTKTVTISSGNQSEVSFTNTQTPGTLKISKICDGFTEKSFIFNVKNSSNNDARSKTIACGSNSSLTLAPGTYTVTETVPAGYSTTNPTKTVTISSGNEAEVSFTNTQIPGYLTISKVCSSGVSVLNGFSFTINGKSGTTTVNCGKASNPIELNPGTYTITETGLPNNIKSDATNNSKIVTITYADTESNPKNITFTNSLITGSVKITKTDGATNSVLSGVTFKLMLINGTSETDATYGTTGAVIGNKITNANGIIEISDLPFGTYKLVEVANANGNYVIIPPTEFTVNATNLNHTISVVNNPISIKFLKTNMDGVKLDNSKFMIKVKETGKTISEIIIEKDGSAVGFEAGKYTIIETQAPIGYTELDSFDVEITEDGKIKLLSTTNEYVFVSADGKTITIKNDRKVIIYKKDSKTKEQIAGASLMIETEEKELVTNWKSNTDPYKISLDPGTYILSEVSAPTKYNLLKEKLTFTVKEDGTITSTNNSNSFIINDNEISVFNVKPTLIPNTGISLKVGLIGLGIALVLGGCYLVYRNVKSKKNQIF